MKSEEARAYFVQFSELMLERDKTRDQEQQCSDHKFGHRWLPVYVSRGYHHRGGRG